MVLSYQIDKRNYKTGEFIVWIMTDGCAYDLEFDLRKLNSPAFVSERVYRACIHIKQKAPQRRTMSLGDKAKKISREIYHDLKDAHEKYHKITLGDI